MWIEKEGGRLLGPRLEVIPNILWDFLRKRTAEVANVEAKTPFQKDFVWNGNLQASAL